MTTEIIEIQKQINSSRFDSTKVETILRKGYDSYIHKMDIMKQVCDKLSALRMRYLIWYEGEWTHTLNNTPTLTTDEYILGLLVSVDNQYITTDQFPLADIAERMKKPDASNLKKAMQGR